MEIPREVATVCFVAGAVLAWFLAIAIFAIGPGRPVNRRMALLFGVEGFFLGGLGLRDILENEWLPGGQRAAEAARNVGDAATVVAPWVYLWFLAKALPGRSGAWLDRRWTTPALGVGAMASGLWWWTSHPHVEETLRDFQIRMIPLLVWAVAGLLAVVLAAWALAESPPRSVERMQARLYFIAFASRDAVWVMMFVILFTAAYGILPDPARALVLGIGGVNSLFTVAYIVFLPLVALAVARGNVLHIRGPLRFAGTVVPRGAPEAIDAYRLALLQADRNSAAIQARLQVDERAAAWLRDWQRQQARPGDTILGRYQLVRALGAGVQGLTYLARDRVSRQEIVLKATHGDDEALKAEAQALQQIRHPNVLAVLQVEPVGGSIVLVTAYARGGDLAALLRKGALGGKQTRRVVADVLLGVAAIHATGLLHGDIKPANIFMRSGKAIVGDLGLADGRGSGSLAYLSPERARGLAADAASDLWAVAAVAYVCITGRQLVAARADETGYEVRQRIAARSGFVEDVPDEWRAWMTRALHPDPRRRFRSAEDMLAALPRPSDGAVTPGRPTGSGRHQSRPPGPDAPPRRAPSAAS